MNKKILLTGEEKEAVLIHEFLTQKGYRVVDIPNPRGEALPNIQPDGVAAIVASVSIKNPYLPVSELRRLFPGVPVVAIMGTDDEAAHLQMIKDGAQETLVKGKFDAAKLARAINMACERKAQTQKIRTVLDDYKRHFENGPMPMWIVNIATMEFLAVNQTAVEKYGYSKEEFSRMTLRDVRPEEDVEMLMASYYQYDANYFDAGYWRHRKKNGEVFYVHIYSHTTDFENTPARLSFCVDVHEKLLTEQRNHELNELIKEQKEQLDGILYSISDAIWSRRADNNELIYANNAYYQLFGLPQGEVKRDMELVLSSVHPNDKRMFLGALDEVRETGQTEAAYRYIDKEGNVRALKTTAIFKKGINGKPDTIDGITIDFTKEKELYDTIRNNEHQLMSTINNTNDLIWTVDTDLKLLFCNKPYQDHFYRLAGVVLDEGDYVLGAWHTEPFIARRKKEYQRALNGESFSTVIEERRNGKVQYYEINSNPVPDHHGNIIGVNCVARDITEQRMQLMRIKHQNDRLREIAWIQSHKVRRPVASILGLINLINQEADSVIDCEIVEMLRIATTDLDNVIREVVDKTDDIDQSINHASPKGLAKRHQNRSATPRPKSA